MIEINTQNLLEHFTFWRVVGVILLIYILKIAAKYIGIWIFLRNFKRKYGNDASTYFQFPLGLPYKLENDPYDSVSWHKQSIAENPKRRILVTHFGTLKLIFLVDPTLIKDFLTDQSRYKKSAFFELFELILGKGLVFSNGKVWKKHRKLISETFRFDFIASQIPVISRVAKDLFERELTKTKGKNVNILELYQRITGELVFQIFFGQELVDANIKGTSPTKHLSNLVNLMFRNILSPENILFGTFGIKLKLFKRNREVLRSEREFRQFIVNIIEERKKRLNSRSKNVSDHSSDKIKDFLDVLLETQKMSQGTEDEFTDEEVLHEFMTFFVGGMDTTGHVLTMMTYFYYNSPPEVQEAVMKDAEFLVKNTSEITPQKLNEVEVLGAFLKETLRKGGPAPMFFQRESLVDHYIGDVKVSKGTQVNCSFVSNYFNTDYFKDPEKFNLNRWIPGHEDYEATAMKNPFIFTPFSAGSRNCIGQHLATMEAKIIFSIFITNFKFKIPEDYEMRMKIIFVYGPRNPLYIDVENRDEKAPQNSFKCA